MAEQTPPLLGERAPDFSLASTTNETLALGDLRGTPVIIAFYPADWSPVCGDQMALYNELRPEFERLYAVVVGVSVDGAWCHAAFREARGFRIPLLSDFEPKGAVAREYGVYREQDGTTERALFVIDRNGVIRWSYTSPIDVNPGADGILEALERLQQPEAASLRNAS